jgi:hypothetical protein
MSVVFQSADDMYRALRSQYVHELRQLRKTGAMSERDYRAWSEDGQLDAAKYPKIKQLWDEMEKAYPQTRAGMAEAKAIAADSLVPTTAQSVTQVIDTGPLDASVLAFLPTRLGISPVSDFAAAMNIDVNTFLESLRRVRTKLVGVHAYECLDNGVLSIEVQSHE